MGRCDSVRRYRALAAADRQDAPSPGCALAVRPAGGVAHAAAPHRAGPGPGVAGHTGTRTGASDMNSTNPYGCFTWATVALLGVLVVWLWMMWRGP